MRKSKFDFMELIASGDYYVLQRKDDRDWNDIKVKREDGLPAEIHNYPYRINQLPAYLFRELISEVFLREDGSDEHGGTIYRLAQTDCKRSAQAN